MEKELVDEWTDALCSEKYVQGTQFLRTGNNKYCCLGVLYDLVCTKYGIGWSYEPDDTYSCETIHGETFDAAYLPHSVLACIKLSSSKMNKLAKMNDDDRKTFSEIAEWIKENRNNLNEE